MEVKESLKILNRFVELGVRRSKLEKQIGLPLNCLASVLNGKKDFPKAWEAKVEKFILENTVPPIPEPMATLLVKVDEWQYLKLKEQQVFKIDEYKLRIAQLENEVKELVKNHQIKNNTEKSITDILPPIETMFKVPVNKYNEHKGLISSSENRHDLSMKVSLMKKEMFLNNKQKIELEAYARQVLEEKGFYND